MPNGLKLRSGAAGAERDSRRDRGWEPGSDGPGDYDLVDALASGDINPQQYADRTFRAAEERGGVPRLPFRLHR